MIREFLRKISPTARMARLALGIMAVFAAATTLYFLADTAYGRVVLAARDVETVRDLPYVDDGDDRHRLDLYLPRQGRDWPLVVFYHGGFWQGGDRRYYLTTTGLYANVGSALAQQGIAVAVPSYRLAPGASIEDQLDDAAAALRWASDHAASYGADPGRISIMGHSAGAHLALLLAADAPRREAHGLKTTGIRSVVALSPVVDLKRLAAEAGTAFDAAVLYPHFGTSDAELERWSPTYQARPGEPPTLIMVGEGDFTPLRSATPAACEALRAFGNEAQCVEVPGYSHANMVLRFNGPDDGLTGIVTRFILAR